MNKHKKIFIISAGFISFFILNRLFLYKLIGILNTLIIYKSLSYALAYTLIGIPAFIILLFIHKPAQLISSSGISSGFFKGLAAAFIFTLPMFIGYGSLFKFSDTLTFEKAVIMTLCAGFFEELYYRGIFFGQLFRYTKTGFMPAALIGSVIFGAIHLYQGNNIASAAGVFGVTAIGAVFFSWVYVEWNYNLWISIWLHTFMNLSWMLFPSCSNAMGGIFSNVFRILTIAATIIFTVIYKKRNCHKFEINRHNLCVNKEKVQYTKIGRL